MQNAENLFWIGFAAAGAAILFALIQIWRIRNLPRRGQDENPAQAALWGSLKAYCLRQYGAALLAAALLFGALWGLSRIGMADRFLPYAFLSGSLLPILTGFLGLWVSAVAQLRTAEAVEESLDKALKTALTSGTVTGFLGIGLALLELTAWFFALRYSMGYDAARITQIMLAFGLGSAFLSLFSRISVGVFSSGADLAAGAASKGSVTLPLDHFHNPAAMARLTGEMAGGNVGLSADLYSSFSLAVLCAFALSGPAFAGDDLVWSAMLLPLAVAAAGALSSLIATFLIRVREGEPLLNSVRLAGFCSAGLTAAIAAPLTFLLLGTWNLWFSAAAGCLAGFALPFWSQWSASGAHKPIQRLAAPTETDPVSSLLTGLSLGMRSAVLPLLLMGAVLLFAFLSAGGSLALSLYETSYARGAYGVALCAVGFLSTAAMTLTLSAAGSVTGNALSLILMSDRDDGAKARATLLSDLGSSVSSAGKALSGIGSTLTVMTLLVCWVILLRREGALPGEALISPQLLTGLLLGALLAFLFASLILSAVQRTGRTATKELRQQLRTTKGILSGKTLPDHARCTAACAAATLWNMLPPLLVALAAIPLTGALLGPAGAAGLLMGLIAVGLSLSVFLTGAGSIWNNVRRLLRDDPHADEESARSRAAALSDAVGAPLRKAAGPSLTSLIKLCAALAVALSTLMVQWNLPALLG